MIGATTPSSSPRSTVTYVRNGPAQVRAPAVQTGVTTPAGPQQVLEEVDSWWWELWQPSPVPSLNMDSWWAEFEGFPEFPAPAPLDAETVAATLRAIPSAKAAGRDGWDYGDLKRFPIPCLTLLCELYQSTERTGRWPEPIAHSFVAMLPKGGSGSPDDYRPVVLLSVFYRLWAKCRGTAFQTFLVKAGVSPSQPRSAESLAFDLALRMAVGQGDQVAVSGLALDWSKCYDHLLIQVLHKVAAKLGIPDALAKPMLAAYEQPRAVLLHNSIAPERTAISGLAPGCPRATDWLALVIHLYTSSLAKAHPAVVSRPYVDDITSDITTADPVLAHEVVAEMVRHTHAFARDFAFHPNLVKSRRFSTSAAIRASLRSAPGPPVADAFLDLGVVQTPPLRQPPSGQPRHEGTRPG